MITHLFLLEKNMFIMGTLWYHLTTFIKYPYCISGDYINSSSSSVSSFNPIRRRTLIYGRLLFLGRDLGSLLAAEVCHFCWLLFREAEFLKVGFQLLFQWLQVFLHHIPNFIGIHLIIAVNQKMAHTYNDFPGGWPDVNPGTRMSTYTPLHR